MSPIATLRNRRARSTAPSTGRRRGAAEAPSSARPAKAAVKVAQTSSAAVLTGLVIATCCLGLLMVGSASPVISEATYGNAWSVMGNEVLFMSFGLVGFAFLARQDYHRLRRFGPPLLVIAFGLLLAVLVVGRTVMGAKRWIGMSVLTVQPSEVAKLAIVLFCADLIARRQADGSPERRRNGPVALVALAAGALILIEPDMGTAAVVVVIALAMLFAAGMAWKPAAKWGMVLGVIVIAAAVLSPYRRDRLLSFLNPGAHATTTGYQLVQSLIGIGSGHVTGEGLGAGSIKWGSLPNAHTDFIFSILGQELGLVGTLGTLVLFGAIIWVGLRTAVRASDPYGALLAVGVVTWIGLEAIINIASVIGFFPVTGIPLPLVSYGGTSLMTTLVACGILVAVARQERTDAAVRAEGAALARERQAARAAQAAAAARRRSEARPARPTAKAAAARRSSATSRRSVARPTTTARSPRPAPKDARARATSPARPRTTSPTRRPQASAPARPGPRPGATTASSRGARRR